MGNNHKKQNKKNDAFEIEIWKDAKNAKLGLEELWNEIYAKPYFEKYRKSNKQHRNQGFEIPFFEEGDKQNNLGSKKQSNRVKLLLDFNFLDNALNATWESGDESMVRGFCRALLSGQFGTRKKDQINTVNNNNIKYSELVDFIINNVTETVYSQKQYLKNKINDAYSIWELKKNNTNWDFDSKEELDKYKKNYDVRNIIDSIKKNCNDGFYGRIPIESNDSYALLAGFVLICIASFPFVDSRGKKITNYGQIHYYEDISEAQKKIIRDVVDCINSDSDDRKKLVSSFTDEMNNYIEVCESINEEYLTEVNIEKIDIRINEEYIEHIDADFVNATLKENEELMDEVIRIMMEDINKIPNDERKLKEVKEYLERIKDNPMRVQKVVDRINEYHKERFQIK